MNITPRRLASHQACPHQRFIMYDMKEPMKLLARPGVFGRAVKKAVNAYEKAGRSPSEADEVLSRAGLKPKYLREAREILKWHHESRSRDPGQRVVYRGTLRLAVHGTVIDAPVERLERRSSGLTLVEVRTGDEADLDIIEFTMKVTAYVIFKLMRELPMSWEVALLRSRRVVDLPAVTDPRSLEKEIERIILEVKRGLKVQQPYKDGYCIRCGAREFCSMFTDKPKKLSRTPSEIVRNLDLFRQQPETPPTGTS